MIQIEFRRIVDSGTIQEQSNKNLIKNKVIEIFFIRKHLLFLSKMLVDYVPINQPEILGILT